VGKHKIVPQHCPRHRQRRVELACLAQVLLDFVEGLACILDAAQALRVWDKGKHVVTRYIGECMQAADLAVLFGGEIPGLLALKRLSLFLWNSSTTSKTVRLLRADNDMLQEALLVELRGVGAVDDGLVLCPLLVEDLLVGRLEVLQQHLDNHVLCHGAGRAGME